RLEQGRVEAEPCEESRYQKASAVDSKEQSNQPEGSEMQTENQMLAVEASFAPFENRQHQGKQGDHHHDKRASLHINHMIKRTGKLVERNAFGYRPRCGQSRCPVAVGHHVHLDLERSAQAGPAHVRLREKINQVGDKEDLKGVKVGF